MRRRKHLSLLCVVSMIVVFATACGPAPTPEIVKETVVVEQTVVVEPTPVPQDLTILTTADFQSFDPNTLTIQTTLNMRRQVIEQLITHDKTPLLAESWELVDDLTWQFHLREGVEFTNGEPFNAEAVKFSIERILREDNENTTALGPVSAAVDRVDVVDEYTVNIVTKAPAPEFLDVLLLAWMVPPGATDSEGFGAEGIGTGPYMVQSWTPGEAMVMVANPSYWGGKPFFDTVTWRPVLESSVRTTELRAGRADIITEVPIEELGRLDEPGLSIVRVPSARSMRIHLNAGVAPFDDVRVRQAMNYGIDRETILETVLEGAGELMNGPSGPAIFGYDPSIPVYAYDPERARELLAEAGYAGGAEVTLQITEGRYPRDRAVGEAIVAQLADVRITVNANFNQISEFLKVFNKEGNGFMVTGEEDTPLSLFGPNFYSGMESYKRYGYQNDEVDRLYEEATTTMDDAERLATYQELNQVLHDDAPWVFMWAPEDIYGLRSDIVGFDPSATGFYYVKDLSRR